MKRLLIVEDNDIDRESLIRLVGRYKGFDVETARNVEEARSRVGAADVVILDLKLPVKPGGALDPDGGRKILEHIKNLPVGSEPPTVLILSQFKREDSDVTAYQSPHFAFVKEWFHKADDREALSRYLGKIAFKK